MNRELFKKIDDIITSDPTRLDMGSWEDSTPECGTTRCIAGWAVHFASNPGEGAWETRVRLADELDLAGPSWMRVGARLLGLDEHDADALFLQYGEAEAVEALRKLAADE
jgi:hypothetical protein